MRNPIQLTPDRFIDFRMSMAEAEDRRTAGAI
jgi:hypothetical protein